MTYFFVFSASYLQQGNVVFGAVIFSVCFAGLFGWFYFRGVPEMTWRHRGEVILVWIGLVVVLDVGFLLARGGAISQMSLLTGGVYALEALALFAVAYLTAGGIHPRLSSPNLAMDPEKDAS